MECICTEDKSDKTPEKYILKLSGYLSENKKDGSDVHLQRLYRWRNKEY